MLVVNLERNPERWRHARSEYARAGFAAERLTAVDGRDLSDADIAAVMDAERNRRRYKRTLTRGEIGCYLSHRLAWSRIAASGASKSACEVTSGASAMAVSPEGAGAVAPWAVAGWLTVMSVPTP